MAGQTDENRLHVLRHAAFTARDVREMERPLLENGVPLMRMASAATAHVVAEMLEDEGVALERPVKGFGPRWNSPSTRMSSSTR